MQIRPYWYKVIKDIANCYFTSNRTFLRYTILVWIFLLVPNFTLHCKDFHCKNYRYSLCPFSHCSFNAFLTVIDCIQSITAIWIRCSQNLQSLQCDTCIFWILRSTFCALSASIFRGLYLSILHSYNCTFCNPIPAFFRSIE